MREGIALYAFVVLATTLVTLGPHWPVGILFGGAALLAAEIAFALALVDKPEQPLAG
jgi:hypothetical protein